MILIGDLDGDSDGDTGDGGIRMATRMATRMTSKSGLRMDGDSEGAVTVGKDGPGAMAFKLPGLTLTRMVNRMENRMVTRMPVMAESGW